jgi:extracellular elastinolytic metalloproteinase
LKTLADKAVKFYNGPAPVVHVNDDIEDTHAVVCSQLENEVLDHRDLLAEYFASQNGQETVLGSPAHVREAIMGPIEHLYASNCAHVNRPYHEPLAAEGDIGDSKRALLQFMIAATPDDLVLQDILARYDDHLSKMVSSFETHFVGDYSIMIEYIDNVPDTVNPVKAKLVYVQVPKGDRTVLKLVWKVCLLDCGRLGIGTNDICTV